VSVEPPAARQQREFVPFAKWNRSENKRAALSAAIQMWAGTTTLRTQKVTETADELLTWLEEA
jgi:hypothetical protein